MKIDPKKIIKELSQIPRINNGGCGYAAIAIAHAYRSVGKNPIIIAADIRSKFDPLDTTDVANHYYVKVGHQYIDIEGTFKKSHEELRYYKTLAPTTEEHVHLMLRKKTLWNPMFERKHVSTIEALINKKLPK